MQMDIFGFINSLKVGTIRKMAVILNFTLKIYTSNKNEIAIIEEMLV